MPKNNHPGLDPKDGIILFTDGSSDSRDKSGGWAYIALDVDGNEMHDSGGIIGTTNNRMEMTAWIEGLQEIFLWYGECRIIVYSDSEYVGLGAMDRGRHRNKNSDLWQQLDQIVDDHLYVEFHHVRGHTGNEFNEKVDVLAGEARRVYRDKMKEENCPQ